MTKKFDELVEACLSVSKVYQPIGPYLPGLHITATTGLDLGTVLNNREILTNYLDNGGKIINQHPRNIKVREYVNQIKEVPSAVLRAELEKIINTERIEDSQLVDLATELFGEDPAKWEEYLGDLITVTY